tara:strand:- start:1054 stop:2493 length:1440 start_codon:yes stop_codon:yes gene_type:complete
MTLESHEIWAQCLLNIEGRVLARSFDTWFRTTRASQFDSENVVIEVQSAWSADFVESNYLTLIQKVVKEETGFAPEIRFEVAENKLETPNRSELEPTKETGENAQAAVSLPPHKEEKINVTSEEEVDPLSRQLFTSLNEKYTFETFVIGEGNSFAHAAAQAVAKSPGNTQFNPLVIYGGVGLGKTHLLQAIGQYALTHSIVERVAYVPSEKFISDFIHIAIKMRKQAEFQRLYRGADILLVDDIQFLPKTEATQNEFFHTFNALYQAGKQIVMTCDSPPGKLDGLEERLVSRFQWGLLTSIDPPDLETRIAILHQKAEISGIRLPEDVAVFLGNHVSSNIRELEGALIHMMAYCSVNNSELTVEVARRVIQERIPKHSTELSIEVIQRHIADHFDLSQELLISKTRKKEITMPRQIAMFLAKQLTDNPLKLIGLHFGNRDHSTVIHAIQTIDKRCKEDPTFAQLVDNLKNSIHQKQTPV